MRHLRPASIIFALLGPVGLGLAACGDEAALKRNLGLIHDAPDEFQVTTRAPLQMPPNFALQPPHPGAVRPQELPLSRQAEAILVPDAALDSNQTQTKAERALLAKAGPAAPADIRQQIDDRPDTASKGVVGRLLFWQPPPVPGVVIDPAQERQRLTQTQVQAQTQTPSAAKPRPATGDAASAPDRSPEKSSGWLFGLF